MYRYLVFAYDEYYPSGGMEDCMLKTNDLLSAKAKARSLDGYANVFVYDCVNDVEYYGIDIENIDGD